MQTTHRKFIQSGEVLLLKTRYADGFYIKETDVLPKVFDTAADAIRGDDDFVQAIRFDLSDMKGEDVTEDCAAAWLQDWEGTPDDEVPAFVENSEAFENWCEAYRTENGFNERRAYGTYRAVGGHVYG